MNQIVSIIIPVYNVEKYLPQCLDSVLAQTFTELEILIVDDGSTDRSGQICDKYAETDSRIKVYHTDNCGLSAARNFGLDRCNGDYVAFLDSDDWVENRMIEMLVEKILSENADIAVCGHYNEWSNYSEIGTVSNSLSVSQGSQILRDYLYGNDIGVQVWNKLYRFKLFEQIRFPVGRLHEDIATTYRLLDISTKIIKVPEPLIHYRMRKSSIGKTHGLKNLTDCWISCHERYEALKEQYIDCRVPLVTSCMYAIGRFWIWYYGCSKEESAKSIIREMRAFAREHEDDIKRNHSYSRLVRISCLITCFSNPVFFWILYHVNLMHRLFLRLNVRRMFK